MTIRSVDMMVIDDLFEMGSGYVLNFSDKTFTQFFAELDIDIDDPIYAVDGRSKAKRLRCFLRAVPTQEKVRVLRSLWEYRGLLRVRSGRAEVLANAEGQFLSLLSRIEGQPSSKPGLAPKPAFDFGRIDALRAQLIQLGAMSAQARGYEFERFLKALFDAYALNAREPFRLVGEQIDGSFEFDGETYLLEAKWQNSPTGVGDLHAFHGKLEQKAAWTRGVFVSNSGFTEEGLEAFGRGKKLICVDGLDLFDLLDKKLPLPDVLKRKVRRAAETGNPFVRVRELFV